MPSEANEKFKTLEDTMQLPKRDSKVKEAKKNNPTKYSKEELFAQVDEAIQRSELIGLGGSDSAEEEEKEEKDEDYKQTIIFTGSKVKETKENDPAKYSEAELFAQVEEAIQRSELRVR